ncbi:MAG: FecR family protein [Dysgonomonas sp.]
MFNPEQEKKYDTFTTDDFLLDTFFINSIKNPTRESDEFWAKFIENDSANTSEFIKAKEILLAIKDDENLMLSEIEVDQMLDNIMNKNNEGRTSNNRTIRYWIGISASIAACIIAVIFVFRRTTDQSIVQHQEILSYVEKNKTVNLNDTAIKLVLSDQKTLISEEEEPAIAYDSKDIKLSTQKVSKNESSEFNQLIVPYGKRSKLTLSDGTKIWVNAGTSITYPVEFSDSKREIFVNGEVFLEVAHNANRPFIVKTNNFDIQVLGTKFNVSTYENEMNHVVLTSGSVKISRPADQQDVFLRPNEMYQLCNGKSLKKQVDVEYYTSWVQGLYMFDNEELGVIMRKISRYYGKNIKCSPSIANLKCSGKLDLKDSLDEILNNIGLISSIKYTSQGNNYQIY